MDESRRAELYARRAAILEESRAKEHAVRRAEYVRMVPILAALEDAGEEYDSFGYWKLHGALNHWAHDPARWGIVVETHAPRPTDPAAAIVTALRDRLAEDEPVLVILRSDELVLELRPHVLERHFATLIASGGAREIGFTAPPAEWLVELGPGWIATGRLVEHP